MSEMLHGKDDVSAELTTAELAHLTQKLAKLTQLGCWECITGFAKHHDRVLIGVDEAGRGPLLGPVVAGAVAFDMQAMPQGLACSKAISAHKRNMLRECIQQTAKGLGMGQCSAHEIDKLNILQASLLAMHKAVDVCCTSMGLAPHQVLVVVDGNRLPNWPYAAVAVVKGDAKIPVVSAASIMAKTERDAWCVAYANQHPGYGIEQHKGYPTVSHLEALARFGPLPMHRKSFAPVAKVFANSTWGLQA